MQYSIILIIIGLIKLHDEMEKMRIASKNKKWVLQYANNLNFEKLNSKCS